jgi:two-component system chemotaxis response regulator CheY
VARRFLEGSEYEIDEAENGQAALDKCAVRLPDVVLLDWNMPVMNGLESLRAMREKYGRQKPRVVLCTTESGVDYIRDAVTHGADDYIIKPFDAKVLRSKLAGVLK